MARAFAVKKVSKKMYAGTHNFKDEVVGTSGTDIGFVDTYEAVEDCTVSIISTLDGHRKVLDLSDQGAGQIELFNTFSSPQSNGTYELYFRTDDSAKSSYITNKEGETHSITLKIDNGNLYYHDGGAYQLICAIANDIWYYLRLDFECGAGAHEGLAADKFYVWIDNIRYGPYGFQNVCDSFDNLRLVTLGADSGFHFYIDAVGYSWDPDYTIGDNVHYRHFKESTDSFEGDDVGKQGTDITWVDAVDTAASFEIVQEFNAHKKILRGYYSSAVGGNDNCYHSFASQAKTGWFASWIKVSDATPDNEIQLREDLTGIIKFRISGDKFQVHTAGVWRDVTSAPIPTDDTWYFIYIQWYDAATDTFDLWIDNIQYEDGTNCMVNQTLGTNRCYTFHYSATEYMYLDAPMSSLDSDVRADNRTFDYHDPYTWVDVTSTTIDIINYENNIYGWRKATLVSTEYYEFTNEFFEIYDVNSKLAMVGEIKNRIQSGSIWKYPLRDKNWDDLMERITHTFATDKIHDPTDSTSLLKVALPNVDHTDGDLLLADADTEAATYSPTLKNHPTHEFLRDLCDLGDTVTIVKPNGVVLLDDDLASGDALDIDTAAHKAKFVKPPLVNDILEVINYFEIFGAINPDTGERFYKVIDNSGTDKKHKWRNVPNNSLRTQTDVDAYATTLSTRVGAVRIITFEVSTLGTHNMGETLNLKYVKSPINIPQANYYIVKEEFKSMNTNSATIVLSEGLIEESKYSAAFERPEDYNNAFASEIYETDLITVFPNFWEAGGATRVNKGIRLDDVSEYVVSYFYIDSKIAPDEDVTITWVWERIDGSADTISAKLYLYGHEVGGVGATTIENATAITLNACANGDYEKYVYTFAKADITDGWIYESWFLMFEGARTIEVNNVINRYHRKCEV